MSHLSTVINGTLSWSKLEALVYSNSIGIGGSAEGLQGHPSTSERRWVYRPIWQHPTELPASAFPTLPLGLAFKASSGSNTSTVPTGTPQGMQEEIIPWEHPVLLALVNFDSKKLLHGEQYIRWPDQEASGDATSTTVADSLPMTLTGAAFALELVALVVPRKGGAVIAYFEQTLTDTTATTQNKQKGALSITCSSMFLRGATLKDLSGAGGGGDERKKLLALQKHLSGPKGLRRVLPWRKMATLSSSTFRTKSDITKPTIGNHKFLLAPNQASFYRLNGDRNPIHVDPEAASGVGLQVPIVHGLCTFGYAARGLLLEEHRRVAREGSVGCVNAANRLQHMSGRFVSPVLDGDTLQVRTTTTLEAKRVFVKYEMLRVARGAGGDSGGGAVTLKKPVRVMTGTASFALSGQKSKL